MKRIAIYEKDGHLTLRESTNLERDVTERILRDREAVVYLNRLTSNNKMKDVQITKNFDGSEGLKAHLGNYSVELPNCDKLNKYEKQLSLFLEKAVEALEKQRIAEIKRQRTANGHKEPPKATRDNKYLNLKIAVATLAIIVSNVFASQIPASLNKEDVEIPVLDDIKIEENIPSFEDDADREELQEGLEEDLTYVDIGDSNTIMPITIDYEERSGDLKLETTKQLYGSILEKYANQYGLDPNLVIAVATQERGIHSSTVDVEGGLGLMQIQKGFWENKSLTAYNFETGEEETVIVTENGMQDLETNIKYGCMILSHMMNSCNYNIPAGISSYNFGDTAIRNLMRTCASETGITFDSLIGDPNNCSWLDYRNQSKYGGDPKYLENVISYMGEEFSTYVIKPDGTKVGCSFKSNEISKVY